MQCLRPEGMLDPPPQAVARTAMFGKKKQAPIRTLVGGGALIHGELRFTEGLRIDGECWAT